MVLKLDRRRRISALLLHSNRKASLLSAVFSRRLRLVNGQRRSFCLRCLSFLVILLLAYLYSYWLFHAQKFVLGRVPKDLINKVSKRQPQQFTSTVHKPYRSEWLQGENSFSNNAKDTSTTDNSANTGHDKFIVFLGLRGGQGHGNIISGLLAAHLLGYESNRTVCVSYGYHEFHAAFEAVDPMAVQKCPRVLAKTKGVERPAMSPRQFISLINFGLAPDECWLRQKILSNIEVLYLEGNTYPRWPQVPPNFFYQYYKAKPELLNILPYPVDKPPHTVVHLRAPDGLQDARKGLDDKTLNLLGQTLPRDTYLVTNKIAWYDYFQNQFGWSSPHWHSVIHSAVGIDWNEHNNFNNWHKHNAQQQKEPEVVDNSPSTRNLQMMADWYTILTAKMVYHTHSDFSISAVHWMDIPSKSIQGTTNDGNSLILVEEYFRQEKSMPFLINRTEDGKSEAQLKRCKTGATTPEHKVFEEVPVKDRLAGEKEGLVYYDYNKRDMSHYLKGSVKVNIKKDNN